ncbi:unnamed protein product, partial [Symbiodinium sp. KB8]
MYWSSPWGHFAVDLFITLATDSKTLDSEEYAGVSQCPDTPSRGQHCGLDPEKTVPGHLLESDWPKDFEDVELTEEDFVSWYNNKQWSEEIMVPDPQERQLRRFCKKQGFKITEVERVKAAFDKADKDGSGALDHYEFQQVYCQLEGIDVSQVNETKFRILWQEVDEDFSGSIDLMEFAKWYLNVAPMPKPKTGQRRTYNLQGTSHEYVSLDRDYPDSVIVTVASTPTGASSHYTHDGEKTCENRTAQHLPMRALCSSSPQAEGHQDTEEAVQDKGGPTTDKAKDKEKDNKAETATSRLSPALHGLDLRLRPQWECKMDWPVEMLMIAMTTGIVMVLAQMVMLMMMQWVMAVTRITTKTRIQEGGDDEGAEKQHTLHLEVNRTGSSMAELDAQMIPKARGVALGDIEVAMQAERTERGSDFLAVRNDLDSQWQELNQSLATAANAMATRAEKEHREVLDALAAVCADIELVRGRQKDQGYSTVFEGVEGESIEFKADNEATMDQRLDQLRRDQVENMEQTSASMSTKMARMSGEIMEMQGLQARLQKEIEANLRVELQRFVVEELQVRRLNELEALQKEDSRHRADIDALRDQLTSALEALRSDQAGLREASEASNRAELQALRSQVSGWMEAFSITAQKPLPAPVDTHEDLEKLREDLSEECGELAERLGADVATLRAQMAEGLAEVRTMQAACGGDVQMLRSDWETRWKELKETEPAKVAEKAEEAPSSPLANPATGDEGLIRELLAGQQRQEAQTAELKNRLGMLSREIEEVQKQQLESLRDASAMKQRLTVQVEQLRQEQQSIVDLAEAERQNAGEWNLFKAFGGGCRAPAESTAREESRIRPPPSNAATIEELDLVRAKQHQEALEMKTQQRSFFDEVLNQQSTSQQQLASQLSNQLEVVQSQCTAAIAGLHSQQTSTLE